MNPSQTRQLKTTMRAYKRRFLEKAHWFADQKSMGNNITEWHEKDFIELHHKAAVAESALSIMGEK